MTQSREYKAFRNEQEKSHADDTVRQRQKSQPFEEERGEGALMSQMAMQQIVDRAGARGKKDIEQEIRNEPVAGAGTQRKDDDLAFGAQEHQDLGAEVSGATVKTTDVPVAGKGFKKQRDIEGGIVIELAPGYSVSYADMVALAADHFESIDQMRQFALKTSGAESRAEIEYARQWKLGAKETVIDAEAKKSQEARYYKLALDNRRHFVNPLAINKFAEHAARVAGTPDPASDKVVNGFHIPPYLPDALVGYRYYHLRAITSAAADGANKRGLNQAYGEEAFGDHFLSDSFSAGHLRTERASISDKWNSKYPMFFHNFKGLVSEEAAKGIAAAYTKQLHDKVNNTSVLYVRADTLNRLVQQKIEQQFGKIGTLGLGDLLSGAIHDLDNAAGVNVTSQGVKATVFGDGDLKKGETQQLVTTAMQLGLADVRRAYDLGAQGMSPNDVVKQLLGKDGLFAPERMVPKALPDAQQAPDQGAVFWKFSSLDDLLNHPQIQTALAVFANEKATEMESEIEGLDESQKSALKNGFIEPLKANPAQMIHRIVNWTPTLQDSQFGRNTDDNANDYWKAARNTKGGLASLTMIQRERLIGDLWSGVTIGGDDDAIIEIVQSASQADRKALIAKYGWDKLRNTPDNKFAKAFSNEK